MADRADRADRSSELRTHRPETQDVMLWMAVLAGPLAWVLAEQVSYMTAATACWLGRPLLLYLVALGALGIAGTGAALGWRRWRCLRGPEGSSEKGEPRDSRRRFMAIAGFWMCLGFALAILAFAVPPLLLRVCD
jgi:hypothetical protein